MKTLLAVISIAMLIACGQKNSENQSTDASTLRDDQRPKTLKLLEQAADLAETANGLTYLSTYRVQDTDMEKEFKRILKEYDENITKQMNEGEDWDDICQSNFFADRSEGMKRLEELDQGPAVDIIKKLYRQRKIKEIIVKDWDEKSGEREYCLATQIIIYTTDGGKLVLDYIFFT